MAIKFLSNESIDGTLEVGTLTLGGSAIVAAVGMTIQVDAGSVNAITIDNVGTVSFAYYTYFPNYLFHKGNTDTFLLFGTDTITLRGDSGITLDGPVTANESISITGDVTLDNILLTPAVLPAVDTPSISLRSTNNEVYFQAGSANVFNFMKADYTTMLALDGSTSATFAGSITANTGSKITSSSADTTFTIETTSGTTIFPILDFVSSHSSVGGQIRQGGTSVITFDKSLNSTFAGTISSGSITSTNAISGLSVTARDNMFVKAGQLYIGSDTSVTHDIYRQLVGSGIFSLQLNDSGTYVTRFTVLANGNVGIGTGSPQTKLHLDGANFNTSSITEFKITDHGNNYSLNDVQSVIRMNGRYWSGDDNTAVTTEIRSLKGNSDGSTGSIMSFAVQAAGASTDISGNEAMRIDSSGNVGIGNDGTNIVVTGKGLGIQNIGQDTTASMRLTGANATGNPGVATFTELKHYGADLKFGINHNGGTDVITINPSKNVGIGTTGVYTNNHILNLSGTGIAIKNDTNGSSNNWSQIKNTATNSGSNLTFLTATGTNVMADNGDLGIGTTLPTARLNVLGVGQANNPTVAIDVTNSDSFNHGLEIFDGNLTTGQTVLMAIGHSGSTKLTAIYGFIRNENSLDQNLATIGFWGADNKFTVSAAGNVGIGTGTTPAGTRLQVVGTGTQANFQSSNSYSDILFTNSLSTNFLNFSGSTFIVYQGGGSGSNVTFAVDSGGTATFKADVVAFGSPSDKRLKENIKPIESALDKVSKLQGVTFDWKEQAKDLDKEGNPIDLQQWKHDIGFIAQDVKKIIPELVRENEDGMLSMRHQGLAPILLEAIKELKVEIEELKSNKCNCNK